MVDAYILGFVTENPVTCLLIIGILKIIATETPWAIDDKIVQLITGLLPNKQSK